MVSCTLFGVWMASLLMVGGAGSVYKMAQFDNHVIKQADDIGHFQNCGEFLNTGEGSIEF